MVKEAAAGLEQYTRSSVGHEELRLRFWLGTGSAGLLEDKSGVGCVLMIDVCYVTVGK